MMNVLQVKEESEVPTTHANRKAVGAWIKKSALEVAQDKASDKRRR